VTSGTVRLPYVNTCTTLSSALAEPVAATAATARTWLLLEQPGPWGAQSLSASHLSSAWPRAPGCGWR
jgi:hypothetical protein